MGGAVPKQFLALGGQPLVLHSLRVLQASSIINEIILAVPQNEMDYCLQEVVAKHHFTKVTKVVPGGHERQDSVRHALEAVHADVDVVLVHDAVRPFLTEQMVEGVVKAARAKGAAIIALPMKDTVKQVGADHVIERTIDRQSLWLAQTPQAFRRDWLLAAHRKAHAEGIRATDDAYLLEWAGHPVSVVEGSGENIKVTRPEDMVIGEAILAARSKSGQ
ncbi:2-C-methyl-D-erythritol 4-phosphate cytidylyltransferase [Candidatus Nitrospira nitrificans]|uniref:2-C-methyl-D-erythritol 4-phosphate cytidylyltransferase n=2 Tax=Candidatus Nitrospira nitrificans TaxID=1742973 RepID=A0A0S4LHJ1_9BACT|nr:2-C-methyl-D-erythritol 4-phosphate cytidylyltransferase [Candidatus Nitrospira nitrificans]